MRWIRRTPKTPIERLWDSLAELYQLRALVPDARLAYEDRCEVEFWTPVNSYVETMRLVREGLV